MIRLSCLHLLKTWEITREVTTTGNTKPLKKKRIKRLGYHLLNKRWKTPEKVRLQGNMRKKKENKKVKNQFPAKNLLINPLPQIESRLERNRRQILNLHTQTNLSLLQKVNPLIRVPLLPEWSPSTSIAMAPLKKANPNITVIRTPLRQATASQNKTYPDLAPSSSEIQ